METERGAAEVLALIRLLSCPLAMYTLFNLLQPSFSNGLSHQYGCNTNIIVNI